MNRKSLVRILAVLVAIALAVPLMAKPINKSMTLFQPSKVGAKQLLAGDYQLFIEGTKVVVKQHNKVVTEVEGRWEQRPKKAEYNSVLLGPNQEVQEIRFAGENRVLVLTTP